jgi:catechol 2,3-dioxygenase-like lactoylglutathione lyase family enzyme
MAIDHMGIGVSDLAASRAFYEAALAPLGYEVLREFDGGVGLGTDGTTSLFLLTSRPPLAGQHIAFAADRAAVDAFHPAALAAGGTDNGGPGPRPNLSDTYYAAFVIDPDGNNIEAVSR